jgi:hypothetical protein
MNKPQNAVVPRTSGYPKQELRTGRGAKWFKAMGVGVSSHSGVIPLYNNFTAASRTLPNPMIIANFSHRRPDTPETGRD